MKYSVIIPVFNRPDECHELLDSLCTQGVKDFEVIVVDDGSTTPCRDVCQAFDGILDIHYYNKENSGPGGTRNYAAERASGEWLIILDSDVILPADYLQEVDTALAATPLDAFGGPDSAHPSFTTTQKAINYAMTSFFTTGGIRGGKKKMDRFFPRSFNMGVRRECYLRLGGFADMRFGEDVDFSMRIVEAGLRCRLIPEAWVWHKRRTDLVKFFRQVHNSGIARINLEERHPGSMKLVHTLPALAVIAGCMMLLGCAWIEWLATPMLLWALLIMVDATRLSGSLKVGICAIAASVVQIAGYGTGFLSAAAQRHILRRRGDLQAFRKTFYK